MKYLSILLACFILIGSLFAGDLVITKGSFGDITSNKLGNYSYSTKDKLGATITEDTVLNRIDPKTNTLLDCDLFTCDYKIRVNAKQAIQFDADSIVGKGATVESVFFIDTHEVQKTRPKYGTQTTEECTINNQTLKQECQNITSTIQTGTEIYYENETFENTAIPKLKVNETKTMVIRFSKKNINDIVDIYHTIFGQERKDAAWWNATWEYSFPIDINTTVASNLTNFPARVSMNTSNSTLWNTTTCTNVRFLDSTNTTVLNYDLDSNSAVFCGNATNNATFWVSGNYTGGILTKIYAYLGNTGVPSGENEMAVWGNASYISIYHGNDLIDIMQLNNLTNSGTTNFETNSTKCKIGHCFNYSTTGAYLYSASTGLPMGNDPLTFSSWAWKTSTPGGTDAYGLFGYGAESASSARYFYFGPSSATMIGAAYGGGVIATKATPSVASLTYYASRWNSTGIAITVNASSDAMVPNTINSGVNTNLHIGAVRPGTGAGEGWAHNDGASTQDEVRFRSVVSTTDWLLAEYAQTASVGAVETNNNGLSINIIQTSPLNSTFQLSNVSHIFSVNQSNTTNITVKFYLDYALNQTLTQTANTTYNLTKTMADGLHSWYVFAYQTSNTSNNITSSIYTYTVDTLTPQNLSLNLNNGFFYLLNQTINLSFTEGFFKNCTININGTQFNMVNISSSVCQYNLSGIGNYTIYGTVNDLSGLSSNSSVVNISIFNYSFSTGFETPQYDMLTSPANITFTLNNYWGNITANLSYNGVNYVGSVSGSTISTILIPPIVSGTTTQTLNWTYILLNSSATGTTSNTTTLYSSGLQPCGNLTNTTSLNITVLDQTTGVIVPTANINLYTTYNGPTKTTTWSNATGVLTLCILPNTTSFNTTNTVTITATGYQATYATESFIVSSTKTTKTYYLINMSAAYTTYLKIIKTPNFLISNTLISIYSYTPPSNYTLQRTCTTDAGGQCQVFLVFGTQYIYNFTESGTSYSFGPEILSCTGTTCYRTFTIGTTGNIPLQLTGSLSGSCTYVNTTRTLTCIGTDTSATLTSMTLIANRLGNTTLVCNTTTLGSSVTIPCTLPNLCGVYSATFTGTDVSGNSYFLGSGQMTTFGCGAVGYGRNGWIAALMLFGTMAMIGFFNLAIAMTLGSAALIIGLLLGLIPFEANYLVIVSMTVIGTIMAYRMKV